MMQRIGFSTRAGAFLIDLFLSIVGGAMLGLMAGALYGALFGGVLSGVVFSPAGSDAAGAGAAAGGLMGGFFGGFAGIFFGLCLSTVFYGLIEWIWGASPGKMILGIAIGGADGGAADPQQLLHRYLIKNVPVIATFLAITLGQPSFTTLGWPLGLVIFAGCFLVLGSRRQALHDMMAETAVFGNRDLRYRISDHAPQVLIMVIGVPVLLMAYPLVRALMDGIPKANFTVSTQPQPQSPGGVGVTQPTGRHGQTYPVTKKVTTTSAAPLPGSWKLHLPTGGEYAVQIEQLGPFRYRLAGDVGGLAIIGDYLLVGDQLTMVTLPDNRVTGVEWTVQSDRSLFLTGREDGMDTGAGQPRLTFIR